MSTCHLWKVVKSLTFFSEAERCQFWKQPLISFWNAILQALQKLPFLSQSICPSRLLFQNIDTNRKPQVILKQKLDEFCLPVAGVQSKGSWTSVLALMMTSMIQEFQDCSSSLELLPSCSGSCQPQARSHNHTFGASRWARQESVAEMLNNQKCSQKRALR